MVVMNKRTSQKSRHTQKNSAVVKLNKPGESAPSKGQYVEKGPRGGVVPSGNHIRISRKGVPFPPTRKSGRKWGRATRSSST